VTEVRMGENQKRPRAGLHRAELLQVLFDAVSKNKNIKMHTNKRLNRVDKVNDKEMKLTFQDGTSATTNLVVGADGIHSVVRSHYLKDEPVFSGLVAYRGLIPMEKVLEFWPYHDSDVSGFWTQQGKHFMTYFSMKCTSELTSDILSPRMAVFLTSLLLHLVTRIRPRKNHGYPKLRNQKSSKYTRAGIPLSRN
jgi:2-polyprenyl-6-methoxyphenol hydroxylase-like FAD-dependent oxidoreductase